MFASAFGGLFVCYLLFVIWNFYSSTTPLLQFIIKDSSHVQLETGFF
jgi:hypothetical protein